MKTEFVEEDHVEVDNVEIINNVESTPPRSTPQGEVGTLASDDSSEPIDYSMSTDDTASEVDKLRDFSSKYEQQLENFQIFCHVCLKVLRYTKKDSKKGGDAELPAAQCFMCPRAIYCKNCIYSMNHLKLHTGINIDVPLNKTD